ncbi:MAG: GDYXXLXY domain-containing protein [Flavobacteriales bacterium]|nr:GDYXXLXY domain-containing protein [Flavobacteriales bacterium]
MGRTLIVFALMMIAQWFVPWRSIGANERVLREGAPFRFRTAPVDPHDPFRGEYVMLRFALEDTALIFEGTPYDDDGRQVCLLLRDVNGYAGVERVQAEPPTDGSPYLWCALDVWYSDNDSMMVHIDLPFDRYYLEQGKGRRTEAIMDRREEGMDPELPAYALVRVLDGQGVIEDLMVGDRSIHQWLAE